MSDSAAPENGPAPTAARAVYGFLLLVASALAAALYLAWALLPPAWPRALGLDYWPQRLWALTVPTALLSALLLFVLVIYPLLGLLDVPGLDDPRVHTDEHSLPRRAAPAGGGIAPVYDVPLSEVCRRLYMDGGRRGGAGDGDGRATTGR
ncbi:phosphatidylinositol N-acetylglucosaminyltransferase subunit P-like [Pollicipes pollicipes]|uniref:phosphatidylinositol N-acetylglucosaminyltransferase subunit P-like n=1 Tax=Pollicipes pollicipes TaxID=41117 RepID=UPI001884B16B|nr:phosphatidylinositol N-acetylglucosaminyltransferase subunit P-like [Pollicipes pollicipes]